MIYATLAVTVDLLWGFTGIPHSAGLRSSAWRLRDRYDNDEPRLSPGLMAAALALAIVVPMALGLVVIGSFTTVRRRSTLR
jgi:hypothetical protein